MPEYSAQNFGGIGYRVDFEVNDGNETRVQSYTTNQEGDGLFFHDGKGGRQQIRGTGQFHARNLDDFRRLVGPRIVMRQG